MDEKTPTEAEMKLWLRRSRAEQKNGTPPDETLKAFSSVIERWREANTTSLSGPDILKRTGKAIMLSPFGLASLGACGDMLRYHI